MNHLHTRWRERQARQAAEIDLLARELERSWNTVQSPKADADVVRMSRTCSGAASKGPFRMSLPLAVVYWTVRIRNGLGWFAAGAVAMWLVMR